MQLDTKKWKLIESRAKSIFYHELRDPTSVMEENEVFFIRVWKPLPSICVLKTLRGARKGKPKEDNICLRWTWAVTRTL